MSVLGLFLLLVLSAFIFAKFYEDAIKKLFISELNKRLQTEISVRDIQLSLLRQFPYATLNFEGLVAKDAVSSTPKDTLLDAGTLQLHFNILDLYHKKYVIKRIDLQDTRVNLRIYKDLSDNFHFWKAPEKTVSEKFSFALEKVVLQKVRLSYFNTPARQYYSLFLKQIKGKGKFSEDNFDLKLQGDFIINQLKSGSLVYLSKLPSNVDLALGVDQNTGMYSISRGKVKLAEVNFSLTGKIQYSDQRKELDLHFQAPDAVLGDIINELPAKYAEKLKEYELKGNLALAADLKGTFGGKEIPNFNTTFSVKEGKITYKKENVSLEKLTFSGSYSTFPRDGSPGPFLSINDISGEINQGKFSSQLEITGFNPSQVNFSAKADLGIDELLRFIPDKRIKLGSGDFKLRLNYQGWVQEVDKITTADFLKGQFDCALDLNSVNWELADQAYSFNNFNGTLTFNNNDVEIQKLVGAVNANAFTVQGTFNNMVPFLLSEGENLQVKARLQSPAVNLTSLFTEKRKGSDTALRLVFPDRWAGDLEVNIGKIDFGHFHGEELQCNLKYSGSRLYVNQLSFNAAGGNFTCNGIIDGGDKKYFKVASDVRLQKVDLNRLFYQFGNFGQDYLLDKNLKGIISSDIQCSFTLSPKLEIDLASIIASTDNYVENGELINYEAISGLGKFIRVDDLSRVKFSSLQNTIFIKNKTVIIPSMDVVSDAVNFTISGTHNFNNELNYHFRVLLSDILWKKAKKAKKENEEFGIEQEEEVGKTTLYILLTGTVDNPIFRYDSKGVKGKIVSSFLNEKISLKESLKKEFSRSKKEQDSLALREEHILKQQEDGKFVIDWENSLKDSLDAKKKSSRKSRRTEVKKPEKSPFKVEWEDTPQK